MTKPQGVIVIQSDGRPLLDRFGCVILFVDREHADYVLRKSGYWTGGFVYLTVFKNTGRYSREWHKRVRERAQREMEKENESTDHGA